MSMPMWMSKICTYENPYNIIGIIKLANPKQRPKDIYVKDKIIGTAKV